MKKAVIIGSIIFTLLCSITAMCSISSVNVIGSYGSLRDTPFYASLKEIYVAYLEEVVQPELAKRAKEEYWADYLAQQPQQPAEETENIGAAEQAQEDEGEEPGSAPTKKAPDFKVKLISTMPNICYISSYIFTTNEKAMEDVNKIVLDQKEIYSFLDKVIEYESEKTSENGVTVYIVSVKMKEISELKNLFEDEEQRQLFEDSYKLTRDGINEDEVIYENLYNVDENGNLVLDSAASAGVVEETDFSGLETLSEVPYYCQWDSRWAAKSYGNGTIKSSGCGPTCCAMVVSYFTGQAVTPADLVDQIGNTYYVSGKGSSWGLFPGVAGMYGIKCTDLGKSLTSAIDALRSGHVVIASMGPGTFTKAGHFIVLTGVTADGNVTVNDPAHPDFCSRSFAPDIFSREAKNYWKFSK